MGLNLRRFLKTAIAGYRLSDTRPEQVLALLNSVERLIVSNTVVALFTTYIFFQSESYYVAKGWCLGVMVSLVITTRMARGLRRQTAGKVEPTAIASQLLIMAAMRGFFWMIGFATLLPLASSTQGTLLEFVTFGMMVGGVVAYWALPAAALAFSASVLLGTVIGMCLSNLDRPMAFLFAMAVAFVFFNRIALSHAAAMRKQLDTADKLRSEQEVVGLLLRDYEDNSKDWLWQTDDKGVLIRGEAGFCTVLSNLPLELSALPLVDVLAGQTNASRQHNGIEELRTAMASEAPFSDIEIVAGESASTVHLLLSAKPRLSATGETLGWHGVASNISAERKAEARVHHLAHFDSLTGLPNRSQLRSQVEAKLKQGEPENFWLLYGDLDGFKHVNDSLGHAAGDALLCALAKRFRILMQPGELAARIGGDEFVFLIQREESELEAAWQSLVAAAAAPVSIQGQALVVGMSLGMIALSASNNVDELLRRADLALYNAKQQGKGTARHYLHGMDEAIARRRAMERELRSAIAGRQFVIHYQPIYSCATGALRSYEALLRWQHPTMGEIKVSDFMPVAEECGLINELGGWVLHRACQDAKLFPEGVSVSVNVSTIQLRSRRLLADLARALDDSHLPPSRLELEMTESALMENVDMAESMIASIRALGVGVALDDFGTGYSSLAYLHRFRFDRIKIDRSFVQAYNQRGESRAVVDAVVMIARQLGIPITAEGIETAEQYRAMVDRGCDLAQGFLLGYPAPLNVLPDIQKSKIAI